MANVVTNPAADQTISSHNLLPALGNTTQSLGTASAPWLAYAQSLNETTLYASAFSGATLDLQLAAAFTALGGGPGTVVVDVSGGTIANPITVPDGCDLVGASRGTIITLSYAPGSASAAITMAGNSSIRNLILVNSSTTSYSIYANGVMHLYLSNVILQGGNYGMLFESVNDFRVENCTFDGNPPIGGCFTFLSCKYGQIENPRIESFVLTTSAVSGIRLLGLSGCTEVTVLNPNINGVDCTNISNAAAIAFSNSATRCALTGGVVNGCLNCDGVLCESGASYISITGVVSTANSSLEGAGGPVTPGVGDGFDIFNSSHITLTGCLAYGNGTYMNSCQGFEIFQCFDIVCTGCVGVGNGVHGFKICGAPYTKLVNCVGNYNGHDGSSLVAAIGAVSTANSGSNTILTWVSGQQFGPGWEPGTQVYVNGTNYPLVSVASETSATIAGNLGTHPSYDFSVSSSALYTNCSFEGNGQASGVGAYDQNGIQLGYTTLANYDFSTAAIVSCVATDPQASQTQAYGVSIIDNTRAVLVLNNCRGNKTGMVSNSANNSPQLTEDGSTRNITGNGNLIAAGALQAGAYTIGTAVVMTGNPIAGLSAGQASVGGTTGVGNGASANLTALAKGTGSGPTSDVAHGWLEVNIAGTTAWIPFFE